MRRSPRIWWKGPHLFVYGPTTDGWRCRKPSGNHEKQKERKRKKEAKEAGVHVRPRRRNGGRGDVPATRLEAGFCRKHRHRPQQPLPHPEKREPRHQPALSLFQGTETQFLPRSGGGVRQEIPTRVIGVLKGIHKGFFCGCCEFIGGCCLAGGDEAAYLCGDERIV